MVFLKSVPMAELRVKEKGGRGWEKHRAIERYQELPLCVSMEGLVLLGLSRIGVLHRGSCAVSLSALTSGPPHLLPPAV